MKSIYIIVLFISTVFTSCEIDNFDGPDSGISGVVIDKTTGEGIQTDQPNGYKIRLLEDGYQNAIPQDFWAKYDGSFKNTQLFSNSYTVSVIEGAFINPASQKVTLKKGEITDVSFTVIPFMSIKASEPVVIGKSVQVSYTLSKPAEIAENIQQSRTLVSIVPSVNISSNQYSVSNDLAGKTYAEISSTKYTDLIKDLPSGDYYVRVAARTQNTIGRYNYSKVYKIKIP